MLAIVQRLTETRMRNGWRSLAIFAVLFVGSNTAAVERRGAPQSPAVNSASIKEKIARHFGPGVVAADDRPGYSFPGDFNGDFVEDLFVLVKVQQFSGKDHPTVIALNPWGAKSDSFTGTLGIAILHGTTGKEQSAFLLTDRDFFASPIWTEKSNDPLISLRKRNPAKGKRTVDLPKAARGDSLIIPTEAGIDTTLYWDGKTYRLFTPQEEP